MTTHTQGMPSSSEPLTYDKLRGMAEVHAIPFLAFTVNRSFWDELQATLRQRETEFRRDHGSLHLVKPVRKTEGVFHWDGVPVYIVENQAAGCFKWNNQAAMKTYIALLREMNEYEKSNNA